MNLENAHLTYCSNIHPGEAWDEVLGNVVNHVRAVKARVSRDQPFGVGLRLSAEAARTLGRPETLNAFGDFLRSSGLYLFTVNGFPYGPFHGRAVKDAVYRPDWLEDERLTYTDELARITAALLPPGLEGSISTVPGCFKNRGRLDEVAPALTERLLKHAATLWKLRETTGASVGLALEPEPECVLETTADAARFFEAHLFSKEGVAFFAKLTGLDRAAAEESLRRHLGICLDACHAAVEFESAQESVARLRGAGIRILKLQVTAGLRIVDPDAEKLRALARFAEGVYLHQVVIRRGQTLERHLDLPAALEQARTAPPGDEWRVHFHVPVFREELAPFHSTQPFVAQLLALQAADPFTSHLEVETYTWDVLPADLRGEPVVDAIARELDWTRSQLARGA